MTVLKLSNPGTEAFVPDASPLDQALAGVTCLGIGAHPDDLEFMAAEGILAGLRAPQPGFCGVTITDGAGSVRAGATAGMPDAELARRRAAEQKKAAVLGRYAAQILLGYPSRAAKEADPGVSADLAAILRACPGKTVYTHNLADRHDTHVAVCLRVIEACRGLEPAVRPHRLVGCEAWRDLDWLCREDQVAMPVDEQPDLQIELLKSFESQNQSGKRYDLAIAGRRRAHATLADSHQPDAHSGLILGMDLTPLITNPSLDPAAYVQSLIGRFRDEAAARIHKLSSRRRT